MDIAVIGWYNRQNVGDERILQCLERFFSGHKHSIRSFNIGDAKKNIDRINSYDYVLLGGGGLITRRFNKYYTLFDKIRRPLGCVGIGVEAMNRDMEKSVNLLLEKSDFILVRDKESKEMLRNNFKIMVGPDLTFLSSYDLSDPTDDRIVGLNLRYWCSSEAEYGSYYWHLRNYIEKNLRSFGAVWPRGKWDERKFVSLLREFRGKFLPMPFCLEDVKLARTRSYVSDVDVLRQYFKGVPAAFDPSWFSKIRYLIAMRFHAILFSVQCGIPFVCISYQPKCIRFCQAIGINEYCLDVFSNYDQILDRLVDLENNYEKIRQKLVLSRQELINEITHVMSKILAYMESQVES